jgi:hypothetical protein
MIRICETCGKEQTKSPYWSTQRISAPCIRAKGCPKYTPRPLVDIFKLSTQRDNELRVIKLSG